MAAASAVQDIPTHSSGLTCGWVFPLTPVDITKFSIPYIQTRALRDLSSQILKFVRTCWYRIKCKITTLCGCSTTGGGKLIVEVFSVGFGSRWVTVLFHRKFNINIGSGEWCQTHLVRASNSCSWFLKKFGSLYKKALNWLKSSAAEYLPHIW